MLVRKRRHKVPSRGTGRYGYQRIEMASQFSAEPPLKWQAKGQLQLYRWEPRGVKVSAPRRWFADVVCASVWTGPFFFSDTIGAMLILASASPRRQELLRKAGIPFVAEPTAIPEVPEAGEEPRTFVERLARAKARRIARHRLEDFILGADTTVVVNNEMLNKPMDAADAARMLRMISGRTHQVMTGVCVISPPAKAQLRTENRELRTELVRSELTSVSFEPLSQDDIDFYVSTGEPMDKAGAYGIQGIASRWISRIDGDYSNVVGLPVALVYRMLDESGFLAAG